MEVVGWGGWRVGAGGGRLRWKARGTWLSGKWYEVSGSGVLGVGGGR